MVVLDQEKRGEPLSRAPEAEALRTIVVAGVSSGAGKTSLAESLTALLAERCRTAGAKITVTHGERGCPHGGKGCDVCGTLGGQFQIIDRESIIEQAGTDTARLAAAGGKPVLWAITREEFIGDAWREMRDRMSAAACAVIESNTLALIMKPALTLMVVDPSVSRRIWKPSAERLIAEADFVIFNDRGTAEQRTACLTEVERLRGSTADLIRVSHPSESATHNALVAHLTEFCL